LLLTILLEVPSVAAQAPHRVFEIGSLTLTLAAHLIECLASQHHGVELVEDDPGMRKVFGRTFEVDWAHIHGDSLDLSGMAARSTSALAKAARASELRPSTIRSKRELSASSTSVT
jgi:hypothetical protein